jgi:hypothetical protein
MMDPLRAWPGALLLCLALAACQTERVVLEAVGPMSPTARIEPGAGRLTVFTTREQFSSGEVAYSRYTGYDIRAADGKLFRHVQNHAGGGDEQPETISIPSGLYQVEAVAEGVGPVTIPVLIQAIKTTEIHLERGWKPDMADRKNSDLVRMPTGQIIGWRAPVKSPEPLDESRASRSDAVVKARLLHAPDTVGVAAYAIVETVSVIRNNTDRPIGGRFTVGSRDIHKVVPPGVSLLYLKLSRRADGGFEWFLIED